MDIIRKEVGTTICDRCGDKCIMNESKLEKIMLVNLGLVITDRPVESFYTYIERETTTGILCNICLVTYLRKWLGDEHGF